MSTPLPIITNGFRVANLYHSADATFVNVYWVISAAAETDPGVIGSDFITAYDTDTPNPSMRALHSSDVTFDAVEVTPLDGDTPTVSVLRGAGVHGGGASPAAAANAAFIVTWETGHRGRNKRGRSFLGGCPNASMETGGARWGTALVADGNLWVQNFINALDATGSQLALQVVSQRSAAGPSHSSIFEFRIRAGVGTQRGRTERNKP